MVHDPGLALLLAGGVVAALVMVNLWSGDQERRQRAWRLLRLLLRR